MSTALAIAGVTAVLRDLLNDGLVNHDVSAVLGSTVSVTALPPDRVLGANGAEATQLNLFLYQVTRNAGWANQGLPSRDGDGRSRLANPPLALDLHYLLSAYCAADLHAEIVLGYAMQLLHENPVLDRRAIAAALDPSPDVGTTLPPALRALADCGLADQLEQIRLAPEPMGSEELSKLWTAFQSHYRPTATYVASVVLVESDLPARSPLPVLTRSAGATPSLVSPFPTILSVATEGAQPVASVGARVTLAGDHLDGTARAAVLSSGALGVERAVALPDGTLPSSVSFDVPDLPVGVYDLTLRVVRPGETEPRSSNRVALPVGPRITTPLPLTVARDGGGAATVALSCSPAILPGQRTSLLLGEAEVLRQPEAQPSSAPVFVVPAAQPGEYLVRLRVDGLESALVDRGASPPRFLDQRVSIR